MSTGVPVTLTVGDIADTLLSFNALTLYRATSRAGAYTQIATVPLVTGETVYAYQDTGATGTGTYWYRVGKYNTVTLTESALSEPFPSGVAPLISRGEIRQRAADYLNLYGHPMRDFIMPGPSGTTTTTGTSSTVVCDQFRSSAYPSSMFQFHTLLATSGSQAGKERQIAALSNGTFSMADAFDAALGSGATFEVYEILTASEWNALINMAALDVWQFFREPVGGVTGQTEYSLPYWIEGAEQILNITTTTGTGRAHRVTFGSGAQMEDSPGGGVYLYMGSGLGTNTVLEIEGYRHPAPMSTDTDALLLSEQQQQLFVVSAAARAAKQIAQAPGGHSEDHEMWGNRWQQIEQERQGLAREAGKWKKTTGLRRTPMAYV